MSVAACRPSALTVNLHTHTLRCRHATGTVADYCEAAILKGLRVLGISDHTPLPDGRWPTVRMAMEELTAYNGEIDDARRLYRGRLAVLKAMECEYAPEYRSFYEDVLLGELGFDYLVGAAHSFPYRGEWRPVYRGTTDAAALAGYAAYMVESMESGLFAFMAHPDLFGNAYPRWDAEAAACARDILQAAEALHIPLEINGYGLRKPVIETPEGVRPQYPWKAFWEMAAEYEVRAVVNSDAHRPEDVAASLEEGVAIAAECGVKLVDPEWLPAGAARLQEG